MSKTKEQILASLLINEIKPKLDNVDSVKELIPPRIICLMVDALFDKRIRMQEVREIIEDRLSRKYNGLPSYMLDMIDEVVLTRNNELA